MGGLPSLKPFVRRLQARGRARDRALPRPRWVDAVDWVACWGATRSRDQRGIAQARVRFTGLIDAAVEVQCVSASNWARSVPRNRKWSRAKVVGGDERNVR